jgi:hypothetical protein
MSAVVDRWRALSEGEQRSVQTFANALFLTPVFVLLLVSWSDPPTPQALLVAATVGVLAGLAWFLWSDGRDFSHVSTGQSVVFAITFVVITVAFVTLVLPDGSTPALLVGVLGFNWTIALAGLSRHVL